MAGITLTGYVPSASQFTAAYKAASQSPSGSVSTTLKAPAGTTVKNSAGQLINDAGQVVGGAVTASGQLSYDGKTTIPGSTTYKDTGISTPITPADLSQTPSITVPSATATPGASTYNNLLSSGNVGLGSVNEKGLIVPNLNATDLTSPSKLEDLFKNYLGTAEKPPNLTDEYKKAQADSGILAKQQLVNDLTAKLNTITANSQAAQLAVTGQGRGIPEAIIGGQQAQIAKEAAINALPVQAQLAAAQGNLALAQSNLDTLFKLRVEDVTNEYNYRKDLRDKVYQFASDQEKARLDKIDKAETRVYDQLKTNLSTINDWAKIAVQSGQPDLVTKFNNLNPASPTFRQDLAAVQSKVVDSDKILDRQLKIEQIRKAKAEADQLANASGGNSNDLLAYASDMAATGKLPSPTEVKASGLTVGGVAQMARTLPQPNGFIVNTSTGVADAKVPATEQQDFTRLYNITQNVQRLKELDKKRIGGLVSGTLGAIFGSQDQAAYLATRKAIVDDIQRMQSGAALTPSETAFYADYLPGRFSEPLNFGQDSLNKIENFETIMNDRLKERLASKGLAIYGYSSIDVGGKSYVIGQEIELENGKKGRILPGGYVSTIE